MKIRLNSSTVNNMDERVDWKKLRKFPFIVRSTDFSSNECMLVVGICSTEEKKEEIYGPNISCYAVPLYDMSKVSPLWKNDDGSITIRFSDKSMWVYVSENRNFNMTFTT